MRTSMAFPIRFWAVLLAALVTYQFSTETSADNCNLQKEIELAIEAPNDRLLVKTDKCAQIRLNQTVNDSPVPTNGNDSI